MKKLWIDDERDPGEGWDWAKSWPEALGRLSTDIDEYEVISFDHDLADLAPDRTGYDLLVFVEQWVDRNLIRKLPRLEIHSANPVGYQRMEAAIAAINRNYKGDQYAPMRVTEGMDYEPPPFFMEPE